MEFNRFKLRKPGICITLAASNASKKEKRNADYLCDGTDDDVQIQEAIDAVAPGGEVRLSSGTFTIGSTITLADGVTITGTNPKATQIYLANSSDCTMFQHSGGTINFVTFKHLGIDGNKSNQGAGNWDCIDFGANTDDVLIFDCDIKNAKRDCIRSTGVLNYKINSCLIQLADGKGIYLDGGNDAKIINSKIYLNGLGIYCDTSDFLMSNCYIYYNDTHGMEVSGHAKIVINGNGFKTNGYPSPNTYYDLYIHSEITLNTVSITGNTFDGHLGITDYPLANIYIEKGAAAIDGITISGNALKSAATYGIYLEEADNAVITGNSISGAPTGVFIRNTSDSTVSNNNITGATTGIQAAGSNSIHTDDIIISGNRIPDATTPINVSNIYVYRPMIHGNNWQGSTNDIIVTLTNNERVKDNIDKDGAWFGET